jgi:hypothetical protein
MEGMVVARRDFQAFPPRKSVPCVPLPDAMFFCGLIEERAQFPWVLAGGLKPHISRRRRWLSR